MTAQQILETPDLIAVGATLSRTSWFDYDGNSVSFPEHGALAMAPADTTAIWSSGPKASMTAARPGVPRATTSRAS